MKDELELRCIMGRQAVPASETEQAVYTLVQIRPGNGARQVTMPANVALVLDRSGSMDGEKMDNVKEAVGYVVDHLNDADRVSVTIFDDQVETLIPNQAAKNRKAIKAALAGVVPRGGTQISDGLRAGLAEAMKGHAKDRVNRILLLTDGQTWDDEDACLYLADEAGREGVAVTGIGIGNDWNEKLLLRLAERSHGNSHWIENPVAVLDVFQQEVEGMQAVAATNLRVAVHTAPGVRPFKVHATVPMISDMTRSALQNGSLTVDLGTLDGVQGQTLLIEMRMPAVKAGAFRVGRVEAIYDIPSQGVKGHRAAADLVLAVTDDPERAAKVNAEVMNLVEKIGAFKLQTRALTEAEAGNIAAATQKLQSAATVLLNLGEDGLAAAAEQEILSLRKTGALTAAGTKKLEYGTRKLTQVLTQAIKR